MDRKRIACNRINILINEARKIYNKDPNLSQQYIKRAWKLKMRFKLKLDFDLKTSFCKRCFNVWIPGKTVKIRFDERHKTIQYLCLKCGFVKRFKYK